MHFSILKVGHHGSRTSTSEALLQKASPSIALVSCGKNNRYRHPSIETVGRLNGIHAHIFRTDQDGQIRLDFRKEQIEISTKLYEKTSKLKNRQATFQDKLKGQEAERWNLRNNSIALKTGK